MTACAGAWFECLFCVIPRLTLVSMHRRRPRCPGRIQVRKSGSVGLQTASRHQPAASRHQPAASRLSQTRSRRHRRKRRPGSCGRNPSRRRRRRRCPGGTSVPGQATRSSGTKPTTKKNDIDWPSKLLASPTRAMWHTLRPRSAHAYCMLIVGCLVLAI